MISLRSNAGRTVALRAAPQVGSLTTIFPDIGNIDRIAPKAADQAVLRLRRIRDYTAAAFELNHQQMETSDRCARYTNARHAFYLVAREKTDLPLRIIGAAVKRWDHSTVANGIRRAKDLIRTDQKYADKVESIMNRVKV
jgi:chromosomal replication initiation ATPase DnaA